MLQMYNIEKQISENDFKMFKVVERKKMLKTE